jgi:hypothetical protein
VGGAGILDLGRFGLDLNFVAENRYYLTCRYLVSADTPMEYLH